MDHRFIIALLVLAAALLLAYAALDYRAERREKAAAGLRTGLARLTYRGEHRS